MSGTPDPAVTPQTVAVALPDVLPPMGILTDDQIVQAFAWLDRRVHWIYDGKNTLLIRGHNDALDHREFRVSTLAEFKAWLNYHRVPTSNSSIGLGEAWLRQSQANRYQGIAFDPRGTPAGVLNLWNGFDVDPVEGSWSALQDHLYEVVAGANDEAYRHLECWMARAVQIPWEPGGQSVILRGVPGCGKGVVWRFMLKIFGSHGLYLSHAGSLTSRFNGALFGCVFLFADEVVWGGDIQGASYLKSLQTERVIAIERKGREVFQTRNCIHLGMCSNDAHVARVEAGDRRFTVYDVLDTFVGHNADYFQPIHDLLNNGGPSHLLHHLLKVDLRGWDPYQPLDTEARKRQLLHTLDPMTAWARESLDRGTVAGVAFRRGAEVKVSDVTADYLKTVERRGISHRASETQLGIFLARVLPAMVKVRRRTTPEMQREYWYVLPSLRAARDTFVRETRLPAWPPLEEDEDED